MKRGWISWRIELEEMRLKRKLIERGIGLKSVNTDGVVNWKGSYLKGKQIERGCELKNVGISLTRGIELKGVFVERVVD